MPSTALSLRTVVIHPRLSLLARFLKRKRAATPCLQWNVIRRAVCNTSTHSHLRAKLLSLFRWRTWLFLRCLCIGGAKYNKHRDNTNKVPSATYSSGLLPASSEKDPPASSFPPTLSSCAAAAVSRIGRPSALRTSPAAFRPESADISIADAADSIGAV